MSANGCSTSTGNIANNEFGNKNISGSIILKSKNNSQKKSANTIIKAHDNVAENEGYKMILPSTKGTAEQVLKIDSVTNDLLNLSWGEGGGGSDITVQDEGSSLATPATTLNFTGENVTASGTGATKTINITSDTYSQYSLETGQFSLLSDLTFDSGGGDFSKFFSNSNGNSEFVRFLVSSLSSYPQSFTWTPHTSEVNYPLTKVVMWTRDTNSVNDTEMFPKQFKIYGRPTADSSAGEIEIGKIGDIILSSQPSRSENLLISSAAVNSVINTNKVVYSQYRIEIYQNNSSGFSNKPLIGELRFYRPSSVEQYGNELTNWAENGAGHIIPNENSLYDIGSAEKKVRHLYLSSNSLNIGGVVLSSENDDIKIGENKLVKVTSEPIDGQGLVYSSNQWIPGTVGTSVTANPSSTPTTDLTKVTIDGIDYNVGQKRNYQYKQIQGSYVTSSVGLSYVDINGLDGSNTLQITTLQSDSKIRLHFILRAECSDSEGRNHHFHFQLRRNINGVNTSLNADNITNYTPSLSNNEYSLYPNNQSTLDTFEIYYIDTLTDIDEGTTISYVPQIRWVSNGTPAFHLNTTVDSGGTSHENSLSISEAEEILTGPPLTVNNVAVSGTPNANDILQYNGSAWTTVQSLASDYIYVYRTTMADRYYTTNSNNRPILVWQGSQSSSSDLSWASNGEITVPAGVYLTILNHNFRRDYTYGNSFYQTFAGIYINSTSVAEVADENGKEHGTDSSRSIYGNVNISRILTVNNGDVVKFYHRTYYMGIELTSKSYALLLRIG
jgi:hypothetical protein